jgi:hypothetical protein
MGTGDACGRDREALKKALSKLLLRETRKPSVSGKPSNSERPA